MNRIIDKFEFEVTADKRLEESKTKILNRIQNSKYLVNKSVFKNLIKVDSKELEWMMFPMLPKYTANIYLSSIEETGTNVRVVLKGNFLFILFKYMGLTLSLLGITVWVINKFRPFDEFFDDTIFFAMGPLALFFVLNFINRYNMKIGYKEIYKIVNL